MGGNGTIVQSIVKVDPELAAYVRANTGGANSPYTDLAPVIQGTSPSTVSPNSVIHYEIRSANGKSFSLPVTDCPAVSCTNGDPIAWYGGTAQDQATLAAYKEALDKQTKKDAVTGVLMVGTVATLPATLTGAVVGGAIVGGGSSLAGQAIDKGKVDDPNQVFVATGKGAVLGGLGYGTAIVGGKVLGSVAALDDLFVANAAATVDSMARLCLAARRAQMPMAVRGASPELRDLIALVGLAGVFHPRRRAAAVPSGVEVVR